MKTAELNINLPLSFSQVVDLVKQLPYKEKLKLSKFLLKETKKEVEDDQTYTHYASERVLGEDWMLKEEEEAWKNL